MTDKLCKFGHIIGSDTECPACRISISISNRWSSPTQAMINRKRHKPNISGLNSPEAAEKRRIYFSSDEHKQKARQQALKLAAERRNGIKPLQLKTCDTKPELAVERILQSLNITYIKQYQVGPYLFDFYLPNNNVLIEVQGEYWHSLPNALANDYAKESYIKNNTIHKLRYISELETLSIGAIERILRGLTTSQTQIEINFSDISIATIDHQTTIDLLKSYHYLPNLRNNTKYTHGIYHNKLLIGALVYGKPNYRNVGGDLCKPSDIIELIRLVIRDDYHVKNLISNVLSKSLKLLKSQSHESIVIAFADPTFGHSGGVYKASNWIESGETSASYYYIDGNNAVYHKKTIWNQAKRQKSNELDYAVMHGLRKVFSKPKKRFIYKLRKSASQPTVRTTHVEATCSKCDHKFQVSNSALQRAIAKNGAYICLPCSIAKNWERGSYTNRPKKRMYNTDKSIITVKCLCGKEAQLQQKSLQYAIRKHGQYKCMSCIKRNR